MERKEYHRYSRDFKLEAVRLPDRPEGRDLSATGYSEASAHSRKIDM
jgi:hypothetical protein